MLKTVRIALCTGFQLWGTNFFYLILHGQPQHRKNWKLLGKIKNVTVLKLYEMDFAPGFSSES